ncbi:MAG: aminoacyl-tRNA hydrolase [Bacteroidia bacterium]|nr:aminoacyl-tRNA hydrolase [Bacteroidia bacterium]
MEIDKLIKELSFKATRSSGAGGQHVNKVSSKIELAFDIQKSHILSENQKQRLIKNLETRLTKENVLILFCDESRSQHKNKEIVTKRFLKIISNGLKIPKKRKPTKISRSANRKRLERKKIQAYKKAIRRKPTLE